MVDRPALLRPRTVAVLLPGLFQVAHGRVAAGGYALFLWIFLMGVGAWRWERVVAAPGGSPDERIAFAALLVGLVATWIWSFRDLRRDTGTAEERRSGVFRRTFGRNRLAVAGAMAIGTLCLLALITPFLAPFDPAQQGDLVAARLRGPSAEHLLGTDQYARDVLSRVLYGARISLSIGLVAVAIAMTIGTLIGAAAGYLGGRVDDLIMRFVDMVIAFPRLVLLIAIVALFEPSISVIVVVLGLTQWPLAARIVRGEILSLRERDFVQAAHALGFSRLRIVFRHLIPNCLGPIIVAATLGIGDTIVLEAGLSFLGLGVQPPVPSWGTMVADGRTNLLDAWWITTFPGIAIVVTVLAFNLAGDGLRDALDPRLRS